MADYMPKGGEEFTEEELLAMLKKKRMQMELDTVHLNQVESKADLDVPDDDEPAPTKAVT